MISPSTGCYKGSVSRLGLLLLVSFLTISTGGVLEVMVPERCSPTESASSPADGSCAATCLRCHCARAFDLALYLDTGDAPALLTDWLALPEVAPRSAPHDILHVPKPARG